MPKADIHKIDSGQLPLPAELLVGAILRIMAALALNHVWATILLTEYHYGSRVMAVETLAQDQRQHSQYVDFWNNVLVPKFIRWKHILVDGLTLHSEAIFPSLPVKLDDKVVDAGCGFGDTALKLARLVGPSGSVLAVDCCNAFLEFGRKDAKAAGINNITFLAEDVQIDGPNNKKKFGRPIAR